MTRMTDEKREAIIAEYQARARDNVEDALEDKDLSELDVNDRFLIAQQTMPAVPKTGYNTNQSYSYLEDQVLMPVANTILDELRLELTYDVKGYERQEKRGVYTWTFTLSINEDGPEDLERPQMRPWSYTRDWKWVSEGYSGGDKAASKAVTQARKDWIRSQLRVPGGEENEASQDADDAENGQSAGDFVRASDKKVRMEVHGTSKNDTDIRHQLKEVLDFRYNPNEIFWYKNNVPSKKAVSEKKTIEAMADKLTVKIIPQDEAKE